MDDGPFFTSPPKHLFRPRRAIDPGMLALAGAVVALLFMAVIARTALR